ncbi:Nn.00g059520.m01.CDS01 [Neocucurbitaria sp. VM-36]
MSERPKNLHPSRSFTRLDSTPKSPLSRSRASTLQGPPVPDMLDPLKANMVPEEDESVDADVFVKKDEHDHETEEEARVPDTFEELPIEIRSLTERFLESLTAKVHPTPPSADALADLFQDFYTRASSKINTHIATLSARLTSDTFVSKKTSAPSSKPASIRKGSDPSGEQQMLSATEMADRKRARKSLEAKRFALEEAVERAVCEKVYDRIWRHRSTDDEERDHKLRSRTAALSLVGIGLKELLMTGDELTEEERQKTKEKESEIREWLSTARQDILSMNSEKYPLGKVQHLTAAHKSIVEALSKIFPATSSADEILPTLIYALITLPPEYLNVISDLKFIQRFRGASRMDGETAYCLVNLEAAISFLETVDLSSLRAEEAPGKPDSRPTTPKSEVTPMALGLSDAPDLIQTPATPTSKTGSKEPASPTTTKAQRRLSNLIQTQTNKFEAASDAVRESILDSADQAMGRINNTLDTSFKFFFGGLRDRDPNSPVQEQPALPKTLEDARKLVSSPTREEGDDDSVSVSAASSIQGEDHQEHTGRQGLEAKMTDLFAGRRQIRDRSVDSTKSGGSNSGRRVAFTSAPGVPGVEEKSISPAAVKTEQPAPNNPSAVDSLRNMGNSLNPLNRFANINVLPRFGRAISSGSMAVLPSPTTEQPKASPSPEPLSRTATSEGPQVDEKGARAVAALEQLRKTTPPVKRFVEAKDAQEFKLKEVDELLKEYQRLAAALRGAINY